jgi:predicted esterase
MQTHTIAATTHGRYLSLDAGDDRPAGLLVGFHGQSETAAIQMAHLEAIRNTRPWLLVSIQGLNRYYTRKGDVVAAWMTREDRDVAIEDNLAYVRSVIEQVRAALPDPPARLVYCGFSQGTAMAYRAAVFGGYPCDGLIILAGDLSPDVVPHARRLPPVLLGRGAREEWYTQAKARVDLDHFAAAGVPVVEHVFDDGHVRHPSFVAAAGAFLDQLAARAPR